jgi:hypothetical protein
MDWKLIFQLSLFGLAMGIGTVFFIPSKIEPVFWGGILAFCAYIIAKRAPAKPYLHGLYLGLANSVWITAAHLLFFGRYIVGHPREAAMMTSMPFRDSPRTMMALVGPVVGFVSGLVLGLFALIAHKLLRHSRPV